MIAGGFHLRSVSVVVDDRAVTTCVDDGETVSLRHNDEHDPANVPGTDWFVRYSRPVRYSIWSDFPFTAPFSRCPDHEKRVVISSIVN